jgi:hypothetical protein
MPGLGNPAAVVGNTVGLWLCALPFRGVCPFIPGLRSIISAEGAYSEGD